MVIVLTKTELSFDFYSLHSLIDLTVDADYEYIYFIRYSSLLPLWLVGIRPSQNRATNKKRAVMASHNDGNSISDSIKALR